MRSSDAYAVVILFSTNIVLMNEINKVIAQLQAIAVMQMTSH